MRFITRIIEYILVTSAYTACCAVGLCMATERLLLNSAAHIFSRLHVLIFGATLIVYNLPRVARRPFADEHNQKGIFRNYRFWYFLFFITGIAMAAIGVAAMPVMVTVCCSIIGLIAFAYSLPLLPGRRRLRENGWIKIAVLSCAWTIATAVIPMLYWQRNPVHYSYEIVQRLVFIFILCILFDVRDLATDVKSNVHTLPHKIGIGNSYYLMDAALLLFIMLSILQYCQFRHGGRMAGALLTAAITRGVISYLRKYPSPRAYLLLADGVMLVYALSVFLL